MGRENTPMLWTQRLFLRRFRADDAAALYAILSDPEVTAYLPMFPLSSLDEAKEHLNSAYRNTMPVRPDTGTPSVCAGGQSDRGSACLGQRQPRLWVFSAPVALGPRAHNRSGPRCHGAAAGRRRTLYHGDARCKQPRQRRGHEKAGHALPLFIPRIVAAQEYLGNVSYVPVQPGRSGGPGLSEVLGNLRRPFCGNRRMIDCLSAWKTPGTLKRVPGVLL